LRAAGLNLPAATAIGIITGIALLAAMAVFALSPGLYWAGPLAALAVFWLISSTIAEMARQRSWRFENRLVDAIDLTVGALSAGQTPVDAIASGAEGSLDPVKSELRDLANQLRASVPIERAVRGLVLRYDSEGVRIFTQLLIAKWEVGGPLGPALQAVTRTMRHGLRLRGQLYTHVAGAQTSAIVVALLPYILVAVFLWKRPEALAVVWQLRWGPQLFAAAILLQLAGFVWLRRILRIEL
jgi:tight adherence protein B